jgi:hypothetical protein
MIDSFQRNVMPMQTTANEEREHHEQSTLDPRVLSSVLISLKLAQAQEDSSASRGEDPHTRLLELMHSTPVKALLDTATLFAQRQGVAPHEALQQILANLQEIDKLWNMVLMKEGLARLSSQYH